MLSMLSSIFPPAPSFTEKNLASLTGKVFIVTGAASGVGFELAKILYIAGGNVYVSARSASQCESAINLIKAQISGSQSKGNLNPMVFALADLSTIKPATDRFLAKESRLDALINNAAVMNPKLGSQGKQGHDLEMVTNCLGPYLLTTLLEPALTRTSELSPQYSVRIVFVTALMQFFSPAAAMEFDDNGTPKILPGDNYGKSQPGDNYMQTKVGGSWLAAEFAKRLGSKGILSVSVHPGLMRTELQRTMSAAARISMKLMFKGPVYGAYSELFAAFSPNLKAEDNGGYIMAWGRKADLPKYILKGLKSESEGGSGEANTFVEYCERETSDFQ